MKQKIEIEIDVPEGFEATGEYRKPDNEFCLIEGKATLVSKFLYGHERFILRKVAPKTFDGKVQFNAGWIAKDNDGEIYWHDSKPTTRPSGFWNNDGKDFLLHIVDPFPPDLPWDQCCMQVVPEAGK